MQGHYQPSLITSRESLFMKRFHTHTLQFNLQKDAYFERRIELMLKIFKNSGLNSEKKDDEPHNNGHVFYDDRSLFITFSIMESDYEEFVEAYIKPVWGDRFTEEHVLIDICKHK